uniref:Proline rich and Gla domain 4 n=1 Tax=Xenopus tropicalis TaxID=8364 RepID=A0A803JV80_XENTR
MAPGLRYQTSVVNLVLVCQLTVVVYGFPHCAMKAEESIHVGEEKVFTNKEDASQFIGRRLLYNQFDFEMFVPGNLERECYEEVCNYEEAREIFEDPDAVQLFRESPMHKARSIRNGLEEGGSRRCCLACTKPSPQPNRTSMRYIGIDMQARPDTQHQCLTSLMHLWLNGSKSRWHFGKNTPVKGPSPKKL